MESKNQTGGGLRYLSVCSGIEAATQAWHHMGWTPAAFSEIDKFPAAALAHHYPTVPNLGDMTKFQEWPDLDIDLLVGGTPCQSFSVAGLRKGLADPRGNLMLTYLAIADRYQPDWLVWENVPGVLSSAGGRDFGTFLGALGQLGYGFAYRVLDAQFCGVPQRRRRVFVVGHLGDWRRAAAVLFERHCLQGHPAPSREKREGTTYPVAPCIGASGRGFERSGDTRGDDPVVAVHCADIAHATTTHQAKGGDPTTDNYVTHSLRAEGFDASEDGTGRRTPLVPTFLHLNKGRPDGRKSAHTEMVTLETETIPTLATDGYAQSAIAFDCKATNLGPSADLASTMRSMGHAGSHQNGGGHQAVAMMRESGQGYWMPDDVTGTLRAEGENRQSRPSHVIKQAMQVRRLTPRECERLQGFPDDYTLIPHTYGKPAADGPRYKALGNSMAVPVMRWIGERIALVDWLMKEAA